MIRITQPFILLVCITLQLSCGSANTNNPNLNNQKAPEQNTNMDGELKPPAAPTTCENNLSTEQMMDLYNKSDVTSVQGQAICFDGFVYKEYSTNELPQADIAFLPFQPNEQNVPVIYCQFTGENGDLIRKKKSGDKISVLGKINAIDNPRLHNQMMVKCSIQNK